MSVATVCVAPPRAARRAAACYCLRPCCGGAALPPTVPHVGCTHLHAIRAYGPLAPRVPLLLRTYAGACATEGGVPHVSNNLSTMLQMFVFDHLLFQHKHSTKLKFSRHAGHSLSGLRAARWGGERWGSTLRRAGFFAKVVFIYLYLNLCVLSTQYLVYNGRAEQASPDSVTL